MKNYSTKIIKEYIEKNKELIEEVYCGMREDWSWTAEAVFEDNDYTIDLNRDSVSIAGIGGSTWATPIMEITFKDGRTEIVPCYEDDGERENEYRITQQKMYARLTGGMDYKE
jgi:hypothetical protein